MRKACLVVILGICCQLSAGSASGQYVETPATYFGPFDGGCDSFEMAQSMAVSTTGFVRGLQASVVGDAPFDWYLRDGEGLDPSGSNIEELAVLAAGTAWGDTTGIPWVVLLPEGDMPIEENQVLVLQIVGANAVTWLSGPGDLPGDRYIRESASSPWELHPEPGREFGRVLFAGISPAPIEHIEWGAIKSLYR